MTLSSDSNTPLVIRKIANQDEIEFCANLRASSEPWVTLQRDYQAAINSITAPDHEVYVTLDDKKIAGFAVLCMEGTLAGFIVTLCVAPEYQGQGIGSNLLDFSESRILKDSPNVFLLVSSFNTKAQIFYIKHGYQKVGELNDYVIDGYSEFILRKTISSRNEFFKSH